jgi:hypothetical protein
MEFFMAYSSKKSLDRRFVCFYDLKHFNKFIFYQGTLTEKECFVQLTSASS